MVIYRHHGKGTFVAPRVRKQKILIVPNKKSISKLSRDDYFDFFLGALAEATRSNLPWEPMIIESHDFLNDLDDLELMYPELGGVIFFRGINNLFQAEKTLNKAQIPFMFYGPNIYGDLSNRFPAFYHNESTIAAMAAEYFKKKNYQNIISPLFSDIQHRRSELFKQAAELFSLEYKSFTATFRNESELLEFCRRYIVNKVDAVFCMTDLIAIGITQLLERELNVRVPQEIAVMGIDNIPMSTMLRPSLTSIAINNYHNGQFCIRRFGKYIEDRQIFTEYCELRLIERESTA
jgi:DNA-binding LacI/PurR family transcriptional regulator